MDNLEFKRIADATLAVVDNLLAAWLPQGKYKGHEYYALNPTRADKSLGSFSVNTHTGEWADFATGDAGGDLIALYAYLFCDGKQGQALKEVGEWLGMKFEPVKREEWHGTPKYNKKNDSWKPIAPFAEKCLSYLDGAKSFAYAKGERDVGIRSVYRDDNGNPLCVVQRFVDAKTGAKSDKPFAWCENSKGEAEWRNRRINDPQPLFGLDELARRKEAPVLLVEGEKCKQIASQSSLLSGFVVMTWLGGANGWGKTDFSPLTGRDVILWPDCDSQRERLSNQDKASGLSESDKPFLAWHEQPGMKAMLGIAKVLHELGCTIQFVDIPEVNVLPDGYDIADALIDGGVGLSPVAALSHENLLTYDEIHNRIEMQGFRQPIQSIDSEHDIFPVPLLSSVPMKDGYEIKEELQQQDGNPSETLLRNFALIEGKNKAFDKQKSIEYSRSAMVSRFGREAVDEWFENTRKSVWTQAEVNKAKKAREVWEAENSKEVQDMMSRYVYLDGSAMIWDNQLWKMIDQGAAKLAMGDSFKVWVNSPSRRIVPFENVVFEPSIGESEHYINLFRGLPFEGQAALPKPKDEMPLHLIEICRLFPKTFPIQKLIWHLCNHEYVMIEFFLNWLAYPLQNVGTKMKSAIVLHGEIHGAGKSLLFEDIIKPLYGDYSVTLGQTDLESPYTGNRMAKLFVLFEEIFNNRQKFDHTGAMKHMITGKTMRVEQKFKDSIEQSNYINCAFLSNEIMPFKIEENDRRYGVAYPQSKLPDELKAEISACLDNDGLRDFYSLLMALPLTVSYKNNEKNETIILKTPVRFDEFTEPPMTDAKRNIIALGRTAWQTFFDEWKNGEIEYGDNQFIPFGYAIVDDAWRLFQAWCRKNNESGQMSRPKFLKNITQPNRMHKARRRYRCPSSNTPDVQKQAQILRPCATIPPNDIPEMDFIGPQVMKFKFAVDDYCNK